ncbi:MAG TPA: tripartite tricarboxylate transporter substrate binding protein [Burkholderiales bacterium]|nr:tripartite tricarboxylate transporter substrate binding protein [Burkholderiales bacterium]
MNRLLACCAVLAGLACPAEAQQYPAQTLRMIVAFPPGGGADVAARIIAQPLAEGLGQSVVVENVSGAGGTIGTARAAQAAPDGYTLFVGTPSTHGTNPAVYPKLSYDPVRDFAPIGLIGASPFLLVAAPSLKATSVAELLALARAHPGELDYASYGNGTINHLVGELFSSMADIKVSHIPYRGGAPAMVDLLAGRVQYTFDSTAAFPQIRSGKVKLLGVTSERRWSVLPDVPTVAESGLPGFSAYTWYGLFAPAGTPAPIIDLLNRQLNAALATPGATAGLAKLSLDSGGGAPDVLGKVVQSEIDKWADVARRRNIRLDE